ncbi:MAG TPA: VCBS repeat-containing protein [Ardenticatenaceae bacterium]|nr:VCBS repeat-containing protein [Ardenticatenaceae bacterium]
MRTGILIAIALPLLLASAPSATSSAPAAFPPPTTYQLPGGVVISSSPTLADLNGDGLPEVLVGTTTLNGTSFRYDRTPVLAVLDGSGSPVWSQRLESPINASPAVGDVDNDGLPELIVVSIGGSLEDPKHPGGVVAFDRFGNRLWHFYSQDFSPADGYPDGVFSTPAICDVDGDSDLEIAFGSWDQRIYLLDHAGTSLWNNVPAGVAGPGYFNADTIWSSPACADLNRDGQLEIIIGADITAGTLPDGTPTADGGFLYVLSANGQPLVRRYVPEAVYSSPAVGNLDGDSDLEVVVGTSDFWWKAHGKREQPYVYAFDTAQLFGGLSYADPNKLPNLPGWPQPTPFPGFSSPALADLNLDGDLEIVIGSGNHDRDDDAIAGTGAMHAWHHDGSAVAGWPVFPRNVSGEDAAIVSSPVVADVDADGGLEVLFAMIWDIQVYNADGSFQELLPTAWTVAASPAVADTDNDGRADVWIGTGNFHDRANGYLWRFESDTAGFQPGPWPMFHANPEHTGVHGRLVPIVGPNLDSISAVVEPGGETTVQLRLTNTSPVAADWAVKFEPQNVNATPDEGRIAPNETVPISVEISGRGLRPGIRNLGDLTIGIISVGGVEGADVAIPVTVVVGEIQRLHVPFIRR